MVLVSKKKLGDMLQLYPIAEDFLANFRLEGIAKDVPLLQALAGVDEEILDEFGMSKEDLLAEFCEFIERFIKAETPDDIVSFITIIGGFNKSREPENINFTIAAGEIISIVGPTGSGKSRLLSDIECLAQGDTPTGRKILVNGREVEEIRRFELEGKLVAQLSQNMNFIMDLTVREFLVMHAKSRLTSDIDKVVEKCIQCANDLAGEKFLEDTKVTQLSGGQSRALMIADTAYMSESPIVLIDEIENAGINRRKAMEILAKKEKIILVSTHDPLLALSAHKRIIIKNGGIYKIIKISDEERKSLEAIERLDDTLMMLRRRLRAGELIREDLFK